MGGGAMQLNSLQNSFFYNCNWFYNYLQNGDGGAIGAMGGIIINVGSFVGNAAVGMTSQEDIF